MNEVPTMGEIHVAFEERCNNECKKCRLDGFSCRAQYTYNILTGKMKLTDSFRKEKPKLPAWCKPGTWVMGYNGHTLINHDVMMIEEVYEDGNIKLVNNGWYVNVRHGDIAPVRFRPYTFEEVRKLYGKVMEFTFPNTKCRCKIKIRGAGEVFGRTKINNYDFEAWQNWDATIDGVPIGVPEIDEEALKGGAR